MLFSSDLVESLADMLGNMESIECYKAFIIMEALLNGIEKRIPHIHGYAL